VSAWHLEFATPEQLFGLVRLEQPEDSAFVWFWTALRGVPDVDGLVIVRDLEVPPPRQGLEIRSEGLWAELWCETPNEHWTFGLEAFGLRVESAAEEIGDRVPVGLDLEWEVGDAGPPFGIVHGDVLVGRARIAVDAVGRFFAGDAMPDRDVLGSWLRRDE
jgi:hypothetical protein